MDTSDNHIYYDIAVFNNDTSGAKPVNLNFHEMRSGGALVEKANNYLFSIVRFEIDTPKLPVFIPQPISGSLNDLIYTFVIETVQKENGVITNTNIYKRRVVYTPTNPNINPPTNVQNTANNFSDEYYYIYNFQRWVDMVNTCLKTIHTAINTSDSQELAGTSIQPPFFQYNPDTGKLSLYTSREYVDSYSATLQMNLYWNSPVETIFSGFDTVPALTSKAVLFDFQLPTQTGNTSTFYKLNVRNENNVNVRNLGVGNTAYFVETKQTYASLPMCCPVANIVFTTSGHLPVAHSKQANPNIYQDQTGVIIQDRTDNISPILTDFIVPLTTGNEYKPKINYNPSVYRLIDLIGNAPLKNCDIQVYWKSKIDSKLHPLLLGSQCGASCKIMFRKKQFDNIF